MSHLSFKSLMMRSISIRMVEISMNSQNWLMKISRIFWHWVSTLKKPSSFLIQGIWVLCILTSVDSRNISTLQPLKPSLDFSLLTTVEKLHILLFKQLHASQAVSLTSLAIRTFLASSPVELIRIHTSE